MFLKNYNIIFIKFSIEIQRQISFSWIKRQIIIWSYSWKIYIINMETLEVLGIYRNQRELWKNLNPNSVDLDELSLGQQRNFLDNRIGRYFNLVKPGGISTELGNFYFCKHPDYLPGLTKKASGFFAVDTLTGLAKYKNYVNYVWKSEI